MYKLILGLGLLCSSMLINVSANESQDSGVLGPEVQCQLQDGSLVNTYAQICQAHNGRAL